jgi:hypothetical protein
MREILNALKENTSVKVFVFVGNRMRDPALQRQLIQALQSNATSATTPYTAAQNLAKSSEYSSDPKLRAHAIDQMVSSAILDDAMRDFHQRIRPQQLLQQQLHSATSNEAPADTN